MSDEEGHVNRGPLCNSRKKLPVIFLEHEPHSRGSTGISRRGQVEASQVQPARSWPTGHLMPFAKHAAQESELVKERQRFERQLEHTRKEMEEAIANNDKKHVDEILKEQQKFQAKIDAIEKGREELRTDMEKLIAERERSHKEDHDAQLSEAHEARESLTHEVNQMKKQMEAQAAATQRHKEELERALELAKENEGDVQFVSLLALGALQEQAERAAKLQEEMAKEMIEREAALQRKVSQEQDLRERQMRIDSDQALLNRLQRAAAAAAAAEAVAAAAAAAADVSARPAASALRPAAGLPDKRSVCPTTAPAAPSGE